MSGKLWMNLKIGASAATLALSAVMFAAPASAADSGVAGISLLASSSSHHHASRGHHGQRHHRGHHGSRHHRRSSHGHHGGYRRSSHGHHSGHRRHASHGDHHGSAYYSAGGECTKVRKDGYWHGKKALIGGTMCYDSYGNSYIESGSRYLIRYYDYY